MQGALHTLLVDGHAEFDNTTNLTACTRCAFTKHEESGLAFVLPAYPAYEYDALEEQAGPFLRAALGDTYDTLSRRMFQQV